MLTAGGFVPPALGDDKPEAVLKAMAAKDAGPPLPVLTPDQAKALTASKADKTAAAGAADTAAMPLPDRNPVR